MLASLISSVELVELIVVTLAAGGGLGVGIGRYTKRAYMTRRAEDIKFQEEHKAIQESLLGTPATQWEPARIGIIAAMAQVQSLYADLDERTTSNECWIARQEVRHNGNGSSP
jgi:hypothetical protein